MPSIQSYYISIRIYSDGFYFSITDNAHPLAEMHQKGTNPTDIAKKLQTELTNLHLLDANMISGEIVIYNPIFTLVPTPLYKSENASTWLQFNYGTEIFKMDIYADTLDKYGCTNIYGIPIAISEVIKNKLPHTQLKHGISNMLETKASDIQPTGVYVYPTKQELYLTVLSNGILLLANTFRYTTAEDGVYHILNTYKQLMLSISNTPCYIDTAEAGDDIKNLLSNYIDPC